MENRIKWIKNPVSSCFNAERNSLCNLSLRRIISFRFHLHFAFLLLLLTLFCLLYFTSRTNESDEFNFKFVLYSKSLTTMLNASLLIRDISQINNKSNLDSLISVYVCTKCVCVMLLVEQTEYNIINTKKFYFKKRRRWKKSSEEIKLKFTCEQFAIRMFHRMWIADFLLFLIIYWKWMLE